MAGFMLRRHSFRFIPQLTKTRPKTTYVVLLPESPSDTAEDNALLRTEDLPQFDQLTPEKCWNGIGKLALEYESGVWAVEDKARNEETSFQNIIEELEKLESPLNSSWGTVKTLFTVKNEEMNANIYLKIHERARKARAQKFMSQPIYEACKDMYGREADLDEAQRRVLRKYLLEARLNGIELAPEKSTLLSVTLKKLENQKAEFRKKVIESTNRFSYRVKDPSITSDFPADLLKKMSADRSRYLQGPWEVTLQPDIYNGFLEYCPDTDLRRNTYRAYNMRASNHLSKDVNTSIHIEEIRQLRRDQAQVLGYENFAQISMETKMAGSVDNVLSMITSLLIKAREAQDEEISTLQQFAESRGFDSKLEAWDIAYWRRKQKRILYNLDENQISEYFPFDRVFEGLLSLCSQLFGLTFQEVSNSVIPVWHPDVRFFHVLDASGKHISSFYLDPFKRPGQKLCTTVSSWMLGCRSRSDVSGTTPLATLVFNFLPPSNEKPSLLTLSEVNQLFQKFGHALQHLLTTVPYSEAAGLTNIEWDAVEMCSNFLQNWLYEPSILEQISHHYESGLPLSGSSIQDIIASHNHMAGFDLCTELYFSHLDMQLYTSKEFWLDICRELWEIYRPFTLDRYDAHLCSSTTIIADVWAAAYYSNLWSRMVAADAFEAFRESDNISETGTRFRETFLSLGGGCHPGEVFRRFRGRDPSPDALHTLCGLDKHK